MQFPAAGFLHSGGWSPWELRRSHALRGIGRRTRDQSTTRGARAQRPSARSREGIKRQGADFLSRSPVLLSPLARLPVPSCHFFIGHRHAPGGGFLPRRLPHGGVAEGGFLIRGLQLEDNGPQAVVATTNGHAGLANPVSVVEQPLPRAVGQGKGVLIDRLPCLVTEALRLGVVGVKGPALPAAWDRPSAPRRRIPLPAPGPGWFSER